jgi:branched-chain amino acid aminotransferase
MVDKVFLNDKLLDIDKACISAADSGFLYGAGLFETMRSHNGVVFALQDHLERLFASASTLSINNPYDRQYIKDAIYKLLQANELTDARLRLTLTNGPMSESDEQRKPTLLITATKLQTYPQEFYKNGVTVVLCPFRQNPNDPTCGHKTTSFFSRMLALSLAHQKRAAESLWFTPDNRLAEGCISNVFLVKDSVLYTPLVTTPVLPGIARKTVCRIAAENSIELVEKDLYINDLLGADEVFLTNVIMQVLPVAGIEKHTPVLSCESKNGGDGKVGPVTKKLQNCYAEVFKQVCRRTIST